MVLEILTLNNFCKKTYSKEGLMVTVEVVDLL
jgi:hypothetical protein